MTIEVDGVPSIFLPGDCDSTPPLVITTSSDTVDVAITSSVLSAPGVTFTLVGQSVSAVCKAAGQCPGEVNCSMGKTLSIDASDPSDIIISINYEDVEPWTFCIRPGK